MVGNPVDRFSQNEAQLTRSQQTPSLFYVVRCSEVRAERWPLLLLFEKFKLVSQYNYLIIRVQAGPEF